MSTKKQNKQESRQLKETLKTVYLSGKNTRKMWKVWKADGFDAAMTFIDEHAESMPDPIEMSEPAPCKIWGEEQIEAQALKQMQNASRLPIAVAGALMPDAHYGYGLPIGGVLATDNAVIPYAVGVDIACRMRITIFDVPESALQNHNALLKESLIEQTRFGAGAKFGAGHRVDHAVLEDDAWDATPFLQGLHDSAIKQLGTSGGGNHFVEWGTFRIERPALGLDAPGTYIALLSHSGSRGVGYQIANRYSNLAMDLCPGLPEDVKHLAWLEMDSDPGREYWQAMELAGAFAAANHEVIHQRIAQATGFEVRASIENHHNFAWKEQLNGREVIVHRKGATPAGEGVYGVIPGSMGDPGFVVEGKGNTDAINSASHGAGRKMSRRQAKKTISRRQQLDYIKKRGVELLGGGLDEAPQAYKSIHEVLDAQTDLVKIIGEFQPRIVRMAND